MILGDILVNMTEIKKLSHAKHLIQMVIYGELKSIILISEGGLGKSYLTIKTVEERLKPDEYVYWTGHISPFELYKLLYENPNKIFIFDDVETLLENDDCVSILKAALWEVNGKRKVCYRTKPDLQGNYEESFEFKGGLILLCNKIPRRQDPVMKALESRTAYHEIILTYDKKIEIMNKIIDEHKKLNTTGKDVVKYWLAEMTSECTKNFNLRTMEKLIAFYNYNRKYVKDDRNLYKKLFKATIETDEHKLLVKQLMEKKWLVKHQAKVFSERTGLSRTTYFRIKKELVKEMGGKKNAKSSKVS
jgi:hypothetical protein